MPLPIIAASLILPLKRSLTSIGRSDHRKVPFPPLPELWSFDTSLGPVGTWRPDWEGLRERGLRPRDIALGGDSSGAGLAMALLAVLLARGERPAALHALCPWADLTLSGRSLLVNGWSDPMIPVRRLPEIADLYLAGADPRDPRASPIFADFPGAPPTLIQVGAREALLSDAERAAARLREFGGEVVLEVWPGAPHDWPMLDGWVPESRDALIHAARFLREALTAP